MISSSGSLIILLFFLLLIYSGAATVKIGAIVVNSLAGREQKFAIEVAARQVITSSSILLLNVKLSNSSNPFEASSNAEDLINRWGANAIITGGTWLEVALVAKVGRRTGVPVLSLATIPPLRMASTPVLVQMSYPPSLVVRCMTELISSYNLRRTIVIYEDDDYGSISTSMVAHLNDALRDIGSQIDHFVAFPPVDTLPELRASVRQELEAASNRLCKVFVLVRVSTTLVLHLLEEAQVLGLTTKGYVWITDDQTTSLLCSTLRFTSIPSYYMQGVIGIKAYINESTEPYRNFQERIKQEFHSKHYECGMCYEPEILSLQAYDAMRVIGLAVTSSMEKKSATLLEGILSSKFKGLSGQVQFQRHGGLFVRESSSLAFRVVNFGRKSCRELGFWQAGHGFYEGNREMGPTGMRVDKLGPVNWPGGIWRVPGGWGKLKIGVPARTPFDLFVKVEYDDKGKVKSVGGYCIDVFIQTVKRLKYDLQYEFIPFHGSYDELVDQVYLKTFDAVVGDVTVLAKRSEKVDFTEPYVGSGLAMLVRAKSADKEWLLTKPFTKGLWAMIVFMLAFTGAIAWYVERQDNPQFSGSRTRQLGATLWLIVSTIFFAHSGIHSYYTKLLIMVWLGAVLIITQIYTANLSSILTTQKLEPLVSHSRIGCDGDSFIVKYLQDVLRYPAQRIHKISTAEDYSKAFESGNITAAYMETPYLRVFLSRHRGYTTHGETHRLGGFGFVFPRGLPLVADFSNAILQLSEEGVLKDLENKWFSFSLSNCPSVEKDEKRHSIGLDNMWGLFLLTGGTMIIIFVLFCCCNCKIRGVSLWEKLKGLQMLGRSEKEERLEHTSSPPTTLSGNIMEMEHETLHDVTTESSEAALIATMEHETLHDATTESSKAAPMATRAHHEYGGIEEDIWKSEQYINHIKQKHG